MTAIGTIYQCGMCHRQWGEDGVLLRFQVCVPVMRNCALGDVDCAELVRRDLERVAAARARKIERRREFSTHGGKPVVAPNRQCAGSHHGRNSKATVQTGRMPYKDDDREALPAGVEVKDKSVSARDFETSQNARLLEFFRLPHNFNKWFRATVLEELSGATRMNNRAIWLRDQFLPAGLYLDNYMVSPGHDLPKSSHYRLCRIEDALSLTAEEKAGMIGNEKVRCQSVNAELSHGGDKNL